MLCNVRRFFVGFEGFLDAEETYKKGFGRFRQQIFESDFH